jgi:hypothetical protein
MVEPKRKKRTKAASATMLVLGATILLLSIFYSSTVLAFIGLGLSFWGGLLLYIQDQEYVPRVILDASVLPSLATLNQMIQDLEYKGSAVYLPPRYSEDPEATKIYIPKQKGAPMLAPEEVQKYEKQLFIKSPQGILMIPPGEELAKLFEKKLETSFTKVDLKYLQQNMPKLFIEELEIAENLEFQPEKGSVHARISSSVSKEMCKEAKVSNRYAEKLAAQSAVPSPAQ